MKVLRGMITSHTDRELFISTLRKGLTFLIKIGPAGQWKGVFYWSTGGSSGHGPLDQREFPALIECDVYICISKETKSGKKMEWRGVHEEQN